VTIAIQNGEIAEAGERLSGTPRVRDGRSEVTKQEVERLSAVSRLRPSWWLRNSRKPIKNGLCLEERANIVPPAYPAK
jgi:hypothetical protein